MISLVIGLSFAYAPPTTEVVQKDKPLVAKASPDLSVMALATRSFSFPPHTMTAEQPADVHVR